MSGSVRLFRGLHLSEKLVRRARILLLYLTGQGLLQILGFSVGLLLLRWLTIDNYAQFSIAFSFQTSLSLLTDLGFSATIVALVGPRKDQPEVICSYIRSGQHIRNRVLLIVTPLSAILYIFIARQHHWAQIPSALLFLSIITSIYFNGMVSYHSVPLLIHRKLSEFYRFQIFGAGFRLITTSAMYLARALNAWTTSWINALGYLLIGLLNKHESKSYIRLPAHPDPAITKQMIHYLMPNIPGILFFAVQGQISIYLISIFGQTRSIAEVGALGRLAQIFLLLSSFNLAVIEPFMARLPTERVARNYLTILGIAACICGLLCLVGFLAPGILLLLLGPRYAGLQRETGWVILGACMSYLVGVTWFMATARRWIYWTTTWATIGLIVTAQIVFLSLVRIDSTMHAVLFGCATSAAHLIGMLFNGMYGYVRGPRVKIPEPLHP